MKQYKTEVILASFISIIVITFILVGTVGNRTSVSLKNNMNKLTNNVAAKTTDNNIIYADEVSGSITEGTQAEIEKQTKEKIKKASLEAEKQLAASKVYDNLTLEELSAKFDRVLGKSTLAGKGKLFAEYSLNLGIDPYLAISIVLVETGCEHNCSKQVKTCYNVGGMKGGPSCNGTSYKAFSSLDNGIVSFLDNIYKNYYTKGLKTAEQMNKKYAASTKWATKVNKYMTKLHNV